VKLPAARCPRAQGLDGWRQVVFAADCNDETEHCPCGVDYATECACPGPTEDGYEYRTDRRGVLWGRRRQAKPRG
jgi:hypothetical protein